MSPSLTVTATTLYVDVNNLAPAFPYASWATAATNIQDAVDAAAGGDQILVTNGVYQTGARAVYGMSSRVAVTMPLTVQSVNGAAMTRIVGYQVPGTTNDGAAVRCVYLTNGAVLAGFTLTCGATQSSGDYDKQQSGGGVWCESVSAVVSNCTLTGNSAADSGGGACYGTLNNCTLTGNSGSSSGGAYSATLNNCIVYYNVSRGNYSSRGTLNYCCTTPLPASGTGNFTNAPLFADLAGGDLHLQANSPCINAGLNAYAPGATDLDGNPRISGGTVDVGAYEFQFQDPFHAWLQSYGLPTDGSADYLDSDSDGMNNWQEWVAGTNPTNAASVLRLQMPVLLPASVILTWTSVTNRAYFVQRATSLAAPPAFALLQTNIPGLPDTTSLIDTNPPVSGPVFYRVGVQP